MEHSSTLRLAGIRETRKESLDWRARQDGALREGWIVTVGIGLAELASRVVELARAAGAEQCDVFAVSAEESTVSVRLGEVEKLIEAGSRSLGLRVIQGGRTAVCSTSDLAERTLALAAGSTELALPEVDGLRPGLYRVQLQLGTQRQALALVHE